MSEFFRIKEGDKHFLLALLAVTGVIFFWRGAWAIMDVTPIIQIPSVSIAIGLAIMTFSGVIYREFLPDEGPWTPVLDIIKAAFSHPHSKRKTYIIRYYDEIARTHKSLSHAHLRKVEHTYLITERNGEEHFVPVHRIVDIRSEGKLIWEAPKTKK